MSDDSGPKILIERLGHLGDGIAKGPIYAPRTLPGEEVTGEVVDGRMASPKILTPSDQRVKPICPHYNACGGCALLHASDSFVATWKEGVIRAALGAYDLVPKFRPISTSPPNARRRAVLSVRRSKKSAVAGFHARRSNTITEIPNCKLLHPDIIAALPSVAKLATIGGTRKGELSVTVVQSAAGLDVSVQGGKPLEQSLETRLAEALHAFGFARLSWNGEVVGAETPPGQVFGKAAVVPPPGAFLQATREGEAALVAAVTEIVQGADRVADLFAGCGTLSLPLAGFAQVHAVEGDGEMLAALDAGWRKSSGLRHVSTETRDLFRNPLMTEDLARYDAVVIDPPRAGAAAQVSQLALSVIPRIAMVSCNPASFARDAKLLAAAGYTLDWVKTVDQFRWSSHVELVACFSHG